MVWQPLVEVQLYLTPLSFNVNGKTTQAALYFSRHKMRLTRVNLLATSTQACKIPEDEGWVILPPPHP